MAKITISNNTPKGIGYYVGSKVINIIPGLHIDCMTEEEFESLLVFKKHPIHKQIANKEITIIRNTPEIGKVKKDANQVIVTEFEGEEVPVHAGELGGKFTKSGTIKGIKEAVDAPKVTEQKTTRRTTRRKPADEE